MKRKYDGNLVFGIVIGLAIIALLIINGCSSGTTDPTDVLVLVTWEATYDLQGEDSVAVTSYDFRWSDAPITDANWATASQLVSGTPKEPFMPETLAVVLPMESYTNYYFRAKVEDNFGNVSEISNEAVFKSDDVIPPNAIFISVQKGN